MIRKFLDGIIYGIGFGFAFFTVGIVVMYFILPVVIKDRFQSLESDHGESEVKTVPEVEQPKRFLGSTAVFSGDFKNSTGEVLSSGDGQIIGSAISNGQPVEGLRLRLALNGRVMSQWATTDSKGKYIVKVPYGRYVIDGFELDRDTTNKTLPNKIRHPQSAYSSNIFDLSAQNSGRGIDFIFVDPIIKKIKKNVYVSTEEVVLEWEPYPKAAEYSVQLYEKADAYSWKNNPLYEWSDKPKVPEPHINLSKHGVQLKAGHFYSYDVYAMDRQGNQLSETARKHSSHDFAVVE